LHQQISPMAFNKKIKASSSANTGFGSNASNYGGRLLNKDGTPNIRKTGIGFFERFSWFHSMLALSRLNFFLIIICFFIGINLFFTVIYYLVGTSHLAGMNTSSAWERFSEAFFFSSQTFTTVGYGRISPIGFMASAIAAFEALIGLMSFALVTGLLYGRFSRPKAYLKFASNALIAPYRDITALMVRLAPFKNTTLTDAEAKLTLALILDENGNAANRFYNLDLELPTVNALTLSWTLVHPIIDESPIHGLTKEDFKNATGEIIVYIKAFDDMFSNTVISRTSYTFDELIFGAKFTPMFHRDHDRNTTVLDLDKLNLFETAALPEQKLLPAE
jgi:inward rectifier potassium channel